MSDSVINDVIPEDSVVNSSSDSNGKDHDSHDHYLQYLNLPHHHRTRTLSESERIASGPIFRGTIQSFCRQKGHGFIKPNDGSDPIFLHISDIEGEWCPKEGDIVSFKKALMPPKMQKYQAVHVTFVHLKEGIKHEHWEVQPQTLSDVKNGAQ